MGQLVLTVAGGPGPSRGTVEIDAGDGLDVEPPGPLSYELPALGHARWDLAVRLRPGAAAGHRFVAARIRDEAGQLIEDAVLVAPGAAGGAAETGRAADIGGAADPGGAGGIRAAWEQATAAITAEADLRISPRELVLAPGGAGVIEVALDSRAASEIRGEAQLISPVGSWEFLPRWTTGFAVAAGNSALLKFPLAAPATARPGQRWWVIAKVMYFGRVRYSEPAEVAVG